MLNDKSYIVYNISNNSNNSEINIQLLICNCTKILRNFKNNGKV